MDEAAIEEHEKEYNEVSEQLEQAASKKNTENNESDQAWVTKNKNLQKWQFHSGTVIVFRKVKNLSTLKIILDRKSVV